MGGSSEQEIGSKYFGGKIQKRRERRVMKRSRATVSGRLEGRKELLAEAIGSWAREKLHLREKSIPKAEELKL